MLSLGGAKTCLRGMAGGQCVWRTFTYLRLLWDRVTFFQTVTVLWSCFSVAKSAGLCLHESLFIEMSVRRDLAYICTDENYKLVLMYAPVARIMTKDKKATKVDEKGRWPLQICSDS